MYTSVSSETTHVGLHLLNSIIHNTLQYRISETVAISSWNHKDARVRCRAGPHQLHSAVGMTVDDNWHNIHKNKAKGSHW